MNYTLRKRTIRQSTERVLLLKQPFSEDDILNMHEALLTPGVHYIRVADVATGRSIMKLFLDALNYYHKIGCITLAPESVPQNINDIVHELAERKLLYTVNEMDNYFATEFDYDCIWVESDKRLFQESWFEVFFNELNNLHVTIPVIMFIYEINT